MIKIYGENSMYKYPLTRRKQNVLKATLNNYLWSVYSFASISQPLRITERGVKRDLRKMLNRALICDVILYEPDYGVTATMGFEIVKLEIMVVLERTVLKGFLYMRGTDGYCTGRILSYYQ